MYKEKSCIVCGSIHKNPKYCSRKCSRIDKYGVEIKQRHCICGKYIGSGWKGPKKCEDCRQNYINWDNVSLQEYKDKYGTYQLHSRIRNLSRAKYKKRGLPQICAKCGYNKHVEICHIKPIKKFLNTDSIGLVNDLSNLIALCPNCHWEYDNEISY